MHITSLCQTEPGLELGLARSLLFLQGAGRSQFMLEKTVFSDVPRRSVVAHPVAPEVQQLLDLRSAMICSARDISLPAACGLMRSPWPCARGGSSETRSLAASLIVTLSAGGLAPWTGVAERGGSDEDGAATGVMGAFCTAVNAPSGCAVADEFIDILLVSMIIEFPHVTVRAGV